MSRTARRKRPDWDEPAAESDTAPTPLFPKYSWPHARPLRACEQRQVDWYRRLRDRLHNGPCYAVVVDGGAARQGSAARARFDPFEGMASYGGRYQKRRRTVPKLQGPLAVALFPRQLWPTVEPGFRPAALAVPARRRSVALAADGGDEDDEGGQDDEQQDGDDDEDDEDDEQQQDDDFEDDDDEMGGDYNAEQYFDAGDEDADEADEEAF